MKYPKWHLMFDRSDGALLCESTSSRCEPIVNHCPCFVLHCHTEIEGVHRTLIRIPPEPKRYYSGFNRIRSLKGDATRPMRRRLFQKHPDSKSTVNLDLMRNHLVLAGLRPFIHSSNDDASLSGTAWPDEGSYRYLSAICSAVLDNRQDFLSLHLQQNYG
jgi:hypothetical protein